MMTLRLLRSRPEMIPTVTSWYLADLGGARGKQESFTRQFPALFEVKKVGLHWLEIDAAIQPVKIRLV